MKICETAMISGMNTPSAGEFIRQPAMRINIRKAFVMQFSRIIIYLIFSLIFWECNNPTEISYNSDEERIIGSWNWTKTTGGFGGI